MIVRPGAVVESARFPCAGCLVAPTEMVGAVPDRIRLPCAGARITAVATAGAVVDKTRPPCDGEIETPVAFDITATGNPDGPSLVIAVI